LEQGGSRHRIVNADEGYGAGVAQCLPTAFGALDRGSWTGAFEWFTCDQAFIGQVKRHCHKVHNLTLPFKIREPRQCELT
jgi:hypothetical protein